MKKKILETSMLLFQFIYYIVRGWDEQLRLPAWVTQSKTYVVFLALELFLMATVCLIVHRMIFGHAFVGADLPDLDKPSSIIVFIGCTSVTYYINQKILGSDRRIEHYKKIFDAWDKWKRRRWRFYVTSIMISVYAVFMIVAEADQFGLHPKKWIEDVSESIGSHLTE
jgi:hypothetical protein